jgi:hypothetical protein
MIVFRLFRDHVPVTGSVGATIRPEAGDGQFRAPIGAAVGHVRGLQAVDRGVDAFLQAGPVLRSALGQEPGVAGQLDDGEQAAGRERVADVAQCAARVGRERRRTAPLRPAASEFLHRFLADAGFRPSGIARHGLGTTFDPVSGSSK